MRRLWICRRLAQGLSERAGPVSHGSGWQRSEGSGCRDYGSATRLQDGHSSTGRRRLPPSGFRDSQGQQSTRVGRVIGVGKRIMKLNPRDRTNKRFQEPGTQERGNGMPAFGIRAACCHRMLPLARGLVFTLSVVGNSRSRGCPIQECTIPCYSGQAGVTGSH